MKTIKKTDSFSIQITEIEIDDDNSNAYEITFTADLTPAFVRSTEYFDIDNHDDIDNYDDNETYETYELNIASRHGDNIYSIISGDHCGDVIESESHFIFAFGNEIYEFIKTTAKLFNIPIYENGD